MNNPWTTVKKNIIYQNKYGYVLRDDDVITPVGKPGKYMVFEGPEFVIVLSITKNNEIVFIKQWHYAIETELLELPVGGLNQNETALDAAKRELFEETGATSDEWIELNSFWHCKGAMKQRGHIFLAKNVDLTSKPHLEETEKISVNLVAIDKLTNLMESGKIDDSETLLGLLLARPHL